MSTVKCASILDLEKKERAYQLISQQIPEDKVLQRNNLFVKRSLTNQTSSLKMSDHCLRRRRSCYSCHYYCCWLGQYWAILVRTWW